MNTDDLDAVLAIDQKAFPTPTKRSLMIHELTENRLAEYHVLLEQETIIGYDGFWMMGDEMHISTIAVDSAQRGKGLGELLLLNMLYIAQQNPFNMATLEVRESNQVAQALYTKYQFEIVGKRKRYYRDTGEDALLMTREPLDAPYRNFLERARITLFSRLLQ
jgi:ribosomal-protein-alanine N-acetyltransferase